MRATFVSLVTSASLLAACGGGGDGGITTPPPDADPVAAVVVTPGQATLGLGQTVQLRAETRAADGTTLTGRAVTWASSDEALASVDPASGTTTTVTGLAEGSATITATSEGERGTAAVTVTATTRPVASIVVTPAEQVLIVGQTVQLVAELRAQDGTVLTSRAVSWTSSDPDVAEVDPETGLVLGKSAGGELTITATSEGVEGAATIVVIAFAQISAGATINAHTCAVTTTGAAYCWGPNGRGQLGDGTTIDRTRPVPVSRGSLTTVETGSNHTCGLTRSGQVYCWGSNGSGQLGDGTFADRSVPTVIGAFTFSSVSAGSQYTCGIAGSLAYCWGNNVLGQLGDGTTTFRTLPVQVAPPAGQLTPLEFTALSAGNHHTCGTTATGAAYCWGSNNSGQLGDGTTLNQPTPVAVAPPSGQSTALAFTTLSVGFSHSCGLTEAGVIYCWGGNSSGQLGDGTTSDHSRPAPVVALVAFTAVEAGAAYTCGLGSTGVAYCWGFNGFGQLGDGTTTERTLAAQVAPPVGQSTPLAFASVNAGGAHTCGATREGQAYCWGNNRDGQLGAGTTGRSAVPVAVVSP